MKTLSFLLAALLPLSATPENPLIPATWFQEITAADGSTQQCIIFTTVPGVEYTFYHSDGLENWTEIGKSYGLGQQFSAAMRETAPPPPPPDPENPPPSSPTVFPASITIQSSSDPAGGTVVSWPSLDHGNAVQHLITANMVAAWDTVPLFAETYGTHQFFVFHPTGTTPPPTENEILGTKDSEMIADLEAAWSGFNTAVTTARVTARNTPPPSPPALDSRGFWRIKADWSIDSDNDGIQDHAEFAFAAANPPGADGLAGNPFNADTNGDGRPDGEEIDTDGDGIFDFEDIAKNDKLVAFKKVKLPRYAMFEFADNLQMTDSDGWGWRANAIAINNRGTVLFNDRVWKAGEFHLLNRQMTDIPQQEQGIYYLFSDAFAINDSDQIIGSAGNTFEGTGNGAEYGFNAVCYWTTPDAVPQRVWKDDAGAQINAELPAFYDFPQSLRGKTQLDNNGRFFTKSFSWDINKPPRHEQDQGWKEWTIPQLEGGALTSAAATPYSKGRAERDLIWTSEYDPLAEPWIGGNITSPFTSSIPVEEPSNVVWQGDSDLLTVTSAKAGIPTQVRDQDGIWGWSNLLTDVKDIAADGTAIGRRRSFDNAAGRLLLNGKWTALDRAAPGLPSRWTTSKNVHLADTSSEGWILAHDRDISDFDPDDVSAALLPLRFTGIYTNPDSNETFEEATGVDDFSISSSKPDLSQDPSILEPIREKIWIMAPQEGTKTIKIDAPLHETSKLKISGNALKFNGQNQAVLDGTDQTFTVSAESNIASGNEVEAILEISDGTWDTPSVTRPLAFKVMKKRTVKVIVYKIGEKFPPRPNDPPGGFVREPKLVPAQKLLEDTLNDIYFPQINVKFDVTIEPTQIDTIIDLNDNGRFDYGENEHSPEQQAIATKVAEEVGAVPADTSIAIYMLGTLKRIGDTQNGAYGVTNINPRTAWVKAASNNSSAWEEEETLHAIQTIAHEIGHIIIGEGHPTKDGKRNQGAAPLPDSNHSERLMRHGHDNPKSNAHLLVKAEWDKAEKWLKNEEQEGRIPN